MFLRWPQIWDSNRGQISEWDLKQPKVWKDPADKNQFTKKKKQTRLHNHNLNPSKTTFLPRHFKPVAEKKKNK